MYGDEVGMIGAGGDKAAREDMFPTQVGEWQTESRVGSPPIGKGSSFDVTDDPIEAHLRTLSALRDRYPVLSTGASVVRYAKGAVLVVSRIDLATRTELVEAFNNGGTAARVTVSTAMPGASWSAVFGSGTATTGEGSRLTLTIPPVSAVLAAPGGSIPQAAAATPTLTAASDELSSYYVLRAAVSGPPVTVAFAVRRPGGSWQRLDVDDSPPYRAFLDPSRYPRGKQASVVAIARALDATTAVSKVLTVTPYPR